ncbi:LemA family protein [Sedimentisphaera cyanobacteriorum]|uniref:LemA family protein n=1 Tax=Sedimentisphaera cyanobacteriorum TaxID=1940790 RepID=A0A1Q2HNX8_9BACT|nr:LemA family protein [Sedimentisphaera cyanobacteriorum]AQQ09060.1 LemA family protein [Sedimentisphaera cyanobacteriorum]
MDTSQIVLIVIGVVLVLLILWAIGMYNSLVRFLNQVKNAWSQIDVQLKRRHDLIPNLVETAKGYMKHEQQTLQGVVDARSRALGAGNVNEKIDAEQKLNGAMSQFLLTVENYPDLKANQNFLALQEELTSTENKIAFARQGYNDQAMTYNNKISMFPSNIVAGIFRFTKWNYFEVENEQERQAPEVSF